MLGTILEDPFLKEGSKVNSNRSIKGIGLLPLKTTFLKKKITRQINSESIWPSLTNISGFEIHNGVTKIDRNDQRGLEIKPIFKDLELGWYKENPKGGSTAGSYIHGIFENDEWRAQYINLVRKTKNIPISEKKTKSYKMKRESILDNLANEFNKNFNILTLLN